VGSDFPGKTEIPRSLLQRAIVFPDFRDQAVAEGECQQLDATAIGPDLAELVRDPARYTGLREQLTVFDSTGMAVQDYVVAHVFAEIAAELEVGMRINIQHLPNDRLNPFDFSAALALADAGGVERAH
jgi:L-lysine cyclodeaminase